MTLEEFLQILGGIGVAASLIYVAIQIRNNARAVRASTYQQISNSFVSHWDSLAQNSEFCSLLPRGGDDFTSLKDDTEQTRFYFHLMASMRRFENAWFQYRVGVLKEPDWQAIAYDMTSLLSYPGARFGWDGIKNRSSKEFRVFVDELVKRKVQLAAFDVPREGITAPAKRAKSRNLKA